MQAKKENAQLAKALSDAKKNGINVVSLIEFFTKWYEPKEIHKLIDRMEHTYTLSFLADEDNLCHFDEMKDHLIFLRSVKDIVVPMAS